jgi:hypothetical protein
MIALFLALQDPMEWVRERIDRLAERDIEVREQATRELQRLLDALTAAIETAKRSGDPEVAARARAVLESRKKAPIALKIAGHSTATEGPVTAVFD